MLMIDSDHEKKSLGIFLITRTAGRPGRDRQDGCTRKGIYAAVFSNA
jgi:hypothetical protein